MTHSEAMERKLAERYLLKELTAEQREEYEEHYFSCWLCAKEVKLGAVLVANIKKIMERARAGNE